MDKKQINRPDYCSRPMVKSCEECSLMKYGHDCYNQRVDKERKCNEAWQGGLPLTQGTKKAKDVEKKL